jgi:hypothetical protein
MEESLSRDIRALMDRLDDYDLPLPEGRSMLMAIAETTQALNKLASSLDNLSKRMRNESTSPRQQQFQDGIGPIYEDWRAISSPELGDHLSFRASASLLKDIEDLIIRVPEVAAAILVDPAACGCVTTSCAKCKDHMGISAQAELVIPELNQSGCESRKKTRRKPRRKQVKSLRDNGEWKRNDPGTGRTPPHPTLAEAQMNAYGPLPGLLLSHPELKFQGDIPDGAIFALEL